MPVRVSVAAEANVKPPVVLLICPANTPPVPVIISTLFPNNTDAPLELLTNFSMLAVEYEELMLNIPVPVRMTSLE